MSSNFGQWCRWGALALLAGGLAATGLTGCNAHPVEFTSAGSDFGVSVDYSPSNAESVDILWVIDNSGSMCEEQRDLAANFDRFLTAFANENIDFQMGVTTTHQAPEGLNADFQAKYGRLQSTPNPIPTTFGACGQASTVQDALERAVECTTDPSAYRTTLTTEEQACLDDRNSTACETYCTNNASEAWCEADGSFDANVFKRAVFPPGDAYRDLPLVLRRSDYENNDDVLRTEDLRADFGCMSFVGTSGWSFEKGLGAAQEATHPDNVGPAYDPEAEPPMDAPPNYGLIRKDASFAVIFVTDENDCTYDNDRLESVSDDLKINELDAGDCRDDICEFANSTQVSPDNTPLIPAAEIGDTIVEQLGEIKGRTFTTSEVIVASIHGQPDRYDGPDYDKEGCAADSYETIGTTCSSARGTAFSGDRYQRFVDHFDDGRKFPTGDDPVQGKICTDDFGEELAEIAEIIVGGSRLCITEPVFRCTDPSQCPDPEYLREAGEPPSCDPFAGSGEMYCRNAIQLIMTAPEGVDDAEQALMDTGYCMENTIGDPQFPPRSCIVDYSRYELVVCDANDNGLTVEWTSDTYFQEIGEFQVEVNYAVTPEGPSDSEEQQ